MSNNQNNLGRYHLNFVTLTTTLLPYAMRHSKMINLLYVLHAPLRRMYAELLDFRSKKEYRMRHSGQVFSLEAVLNAASPTTGIYITDAAQNATVMIPADSSSAYASYQVYAAATAQDEQQLMVGSSWSASGDTEIDFVVHLPGVLAAQNMSDVVARLRALVDVYKLAGKRYVMVYEN